MGSYFSSSTAAENASSVDAQDSTDGKENDKLLPSSKKAKTTDEEEQINGHVGSSSLAAAAVALPFGWIEHWITFDSFEQYSAEVVLFFDCRMTKTLVPSILEAGAEFTTIKIDLHDGLAQFIDKKNERIVKVPFRVQFNFSDCTVETYTVSTSADKDLYKTIFTEPIELNTNDPSNTHHVWPNDFAIYDAVSFLSAPTAGVPSEFEFDNCRMQRTVWPAAKLEVGANVRKIRIQLMASADEPTHTLIVDFIVRPDASKQLPCTEAIYRFCARWVWCVDQCIILPASATMVSSSNIADAPATDDDKSDNTVVPLHTEDPAFVDTRNFPDTAVSDDETGFAQVERIRRNRRINSKKRSRPEN